jgi:hypothetical protein
MQWFASDAAEGHKEALRAFLLDRVLKDVPVSISCFLSYGVGKRVSLEFGKDCEGIFLTRDLFDEHFESISE